MTPDLVFELAFEGIQESHAHKSRHRRALSAESAAGARDKRVDEIDTLDSLRALLDAAA